MTKEGIIEYNEPKFLGHKVICKIDRKHSKLLEFAPLYKLKRIRKQESQQAQENDGSEYPKVLIEEVFLLDRFLLKI